MPFDGLMLWDLATTAAAQDWRGENEALGE